MRPKSDKLSWDEDGKTVEAPSSYSQQRIKAVKPRMSWGDDACTVARPADAQLPEDAFRPERVATDVVEFSEAIEPLEVGIAPVPSATDAPGQGAEAEARGVQLPAARHPWRRWILLAVTIPAFYLLSYTAARVVQKLQHSPADSARSGASASQVWVAISEVLQETVDQLRGTPRSR